MPCPRCGKPLYVRGLGNECYTGECGPCCIEIRAVIMGDVSEASVETYSMGCDEIEMPPDDAEYWFSADNAPEEQ